MKPRTRKLVHAGLIALFSGLTDVGAQLATGTLNATRAVIVGLVMGVIGRALGAAIAALAMPEKDA